MAHLFFIDALATATPMTVEQIAFHGGTNLHLSWGSPRYSEDLDFLVNRDMGGRIREIMPKVQRRMQALARAVDPQLKVEIRDRTKDGDGLLNFRVILSSPDVVGQVMAKAEFWQVEAGYLDDYETAFRRPGKPGDIMSRISQPIPAATLEAACADKIVALGFRPYLKWRDLFDIWWISGQVAIDRDRLARTTLHHASAYSGPEGASVAAGLARFLEVDPEDILRQADPDLKRWLPKALWESLNPDGIREMVHHARDMASDMMRRLSALDSGPTGPAGPARPTDGASQDGTVGAASKGVVQLEGCGSVADAAVRMRDRRTRESPQPSGGIDAPGRDAAGGIRVDAADDCGDDLESHRHPEALLTGERLDDGASPGP